VIIRPAEAADVPGLADVLLDCVKGGASVGFMSDLDQAQAESFWRDVLETPGRAVFVAEADAEEEDDGGVVGTVQVVLAAPPNQPHRAEISKMLVHRRARRRGVGEALMRAAEAAAHASRKTLLTLDTASSDAERLYIRLGWQQVGVIPNYALWPDGGFVATTIFYKDLKG